MTTVQTSDRFDGGGMKPQAQAAAWWARVSRHPLEEVRRWKTPFPPIRMWT